MGWIQSWLGKHTRQGRLGPEGWSRAILSPSTSAEEALQALTGSASRWAQIVLEATAPGDLLLELGCGTGAMPDVLTQAGRRVILIRKRPVLDCLSGV